MSRTLKFEFRALIASSIVLFLLLQILPLTFNTKAPGGCKASCLQHSLQPWICRKLIEMLSFVATWSLHRISPRISTRRSKNSLAFQLILTDCCSIHFFISVSFLVLKDSKSNNSSLDTHSLQLHVILCYQNFQKKSFRQILLKL